MWPKRFPIRRMFVASFLISWLTTGLVILGNEQGRPKFTSVSVNALMGMAFFSFPGWVIFLALGGPTLYLLYRLNWTNFAIFAFFGAVYTALPFLIFQQLYFPQDLGSFAIVWPFTGIGLVNGVLTRVIVLWCTTESRDKLLSRSRTR